MKIIYAQIISVFLMVFMAFSMNAQCNVDFTVETTGGNTTVASCNGGTVSSYVRVIAKVKGLPVYFVLTDNNGIILEYSNYPIFNLANTSGSRRIYGVIYMGNPMAVIGQSIFAQKLGGFCYNISSNYIAIEEAQGLEGGMVSLSNNETDVTICVGNGVSDYLEFSTTSSDTGYVYIITDNDGKILGSADAGFDFDNAPPGICRVYGMTYSGAPSIIPGNSINGNLAAGCFERSDNYITVNRVSLEAGQIVSGSGPIINFCPQDGNADRIEASLENVTLGISYAYVLTDENDTIIRIDNVADYDFETLAIQKYRLYGLSYTGSLNAVVGDDLRSVTFSDDCFAVTENYLDINNTSLYAGEIFYSDSTNVKITCPGDGKADSLAFQLVNDSGHDRIFIITDTNQVILTSTAEHYFDFEGAPTGTCFIYSISYTGALTFNPGDTLFDAELSDECFHTTMIPLTVHRVVPEIDSIFLEDGSQSAEVCVGDGVFDILKFSANSYKGNIAYLITDDNDNLIGVNILGVQNFEGAPAGICRIYGLAYTGNIAIEPGDHIFSNDITDGCYETSNNYIQVNRNEIEPGVVSSPLGDTISICPMDGNPDLVPLEFNTSSPNYTYIITDENLNVLAIPNTDTIDFDAAPEGICFIHGLSYTGDLNVMVGETIDPTSMLATGCFALSNYLVVYRFQPESEVITADGAIQDSITVCVGDNTPDVVTFNYTANQPSIKYVITDQDDYVLAMIDNNDFDFDGVVPGVCHMYGLSYSGSFTGVTGEHIDDVSFSDDCFALSSNHITIIRKLVFAGEITTREGSNAAYVCPGDLNPDIVYFSSTLASGDGFVYVITDELDAIIEMTTADSIDFENTTVDYARVYALSYNGQLLLSTGDSLGSAAATGCYHFSDSYIEVFLGQSSSGMVETIDGLTSITVDKNDTISDIVFFRALDAPTYPDFRYVICDEMNRVIVILATNGANFSVAPAGNYRVYYVAFTGNFNLVGGNDILSTMVSDGCYSISENYVAVEIVGTALFDNPYWDGHTFDITPFPNPMSDMAVVDMKTGMDVVPNQITFIRIFDQSGALVLSQKTNYKNRESIDVSALPAGKYTLSIQSGRYEANKPILIQR